MRTRRLRRDLRGGHAFGTIALQQIGRTRTRVTLHFTGPIEDLRSGNYLVDVRNATQAAQFAQACARIGR